jgi:hypothetical protein
MIDGKHLKQKKILIAKFESTWCLISCNIIVVIIIIIIIIIIMNFSPMYRGLEMSFSLIGSFIRCLKIQE